MDHNFLDIKVVSMRRNRCSKQNGSAFYRNVRNNFSKGVYIELTLSAAHYNNNFCLAFIARLVSKRTLMYNTT